MDDLALYLGAMTGAMTRGMPSFAKGSPMIVRVSLSSA